jgi:hypothetical protein
MIFVSFEGINTIVTKYKHILLNKLICKFKYTIAHKYKLQDAQKIKINAETKQDHPPL